MNPLRNLFDRLIGQYTQTPTPTTQAAIDMREQLFDEFVNAILALARGDTDRNIRDLHASKQDKLSDRQIYEAYERHRKTLAP